MRQDREPPAAVEAEQKLCARIFRHPPDIRAARQVWTDDLTDPHHKAFFRTCRDLSLAGEPIDPLLIAERLAGTRFAGEVVFRDKIAVAEYLSELEESAFNADAAVAVKLILEASRKRRIYQTCDHALKATANGQASSTILNDLQSDLYDLQRACEVSSRFKAITAAELDSGEYDQHYLIEHVLVEKQPALLCGQRKTLKTTWLLDAGISIATATKFLGKFWVPAPRSVLLCSGESGPSTLQETARRIAKSKGFELANVPNFTLSLELPKLDDPESLAEFERFIEIVAPDVLMVDPFYLTIGGGDAGNLFIMGSLLRNISELCQRHGITLIIAHHSKLHVHREQFDPPELSDISWSGVPEFCRQWLLIGRRETYEAGSGRHALWLSVGGSAGHGGLYAIDVDEGNKQDPGGRRYEIVVQSAKEARQDAAEREQESKKEKKAEQVEIDRKTICEALTALPDRIGTKTDIKDATPLNDSRFRPAFASLIKDKTLAKTTIKKGNNQTYDAYTFTPESDP